MNAPGFPRIESGVIPGYAPERRGFFAAVGLSIPASAFSRSVSVTIPSTIRDASTTGRPLFALRQAGGLTLIKLANPGSGLMCIMEAG